MSQTSIGTSPRPWPARPRRKAVRDIEVERDERIALAGENEKLADRLSRRVTAHVLERQHAMKGLSGNISVASAATSAKPGSVW